MLTGRETPKRCLVLSLYPEIHSLLIPLCEEFNLLPDFMVYRKSALSYFLQYKHSLIIVDAHFLPRFAFRLVQLFKIAHREPAVVVLNDTGKSLAGFERLSGYCVRVVEEPFTHGGVQVVLAEAVGVMNRMVQAVFVKNLLVQIGIVVPLVGLMVYLLVRGGVGP